MKHFFASVFCLGLYLLTPAQGQDRVLPDPGGSAADLAERYRHALPANQFQQLSTNGNTDFPALWIEQMTSAPQGGALILHDAAQHPDWPRLIHEIRQHLPEVGWSTLAIALPAPARQTVPQRHRLVDEPVTAAAAPPEPDPSIAAETNARIGTGIRELTRRGYLNLVVIAVGDAALPATGFLRDGLQNADNVGLILLDPAPARTTDLLPLLGELSLPVLDVYPPGQHSEAAARQRHAAMARNPDARLTQVREQRWLSPWRSSPQPIARRTWGWLRSNMAGAEREVEYVDAGAQ